MLMEVNLLTHGRALNIGMFGMHSKLSMGTKIHSRYVLDVVLLMEGNVAD